jgi:hypothetical protein
MVFDRAGSAEHQRQASIAQDEFAAKIRRDVLKRLDEDRVFIPRSDPYDARVA